MVKLFSIKEHYSELIFNREKKVEFRRQNVNINKDETCLIYTSSPVKKLTGYFIVKEKLRLPIPKLWARTKDIAGITKKEFLAYFEGCKEGTAIVFKFVKRFVRAVGLNNLRQKVREFRPPQSYYSLDKEIAFKFLSILGEEKLLFS